MWPFITSIIRITQLTRACGYIFNEIQRYVLRITIRLGFGTIVNIPKFCYRTLLYNFIFNTKWSFGDCELLWHLWLGSGSMNSRSIPPCVESNLASCDLSTSWTVNVSSARNGDCFAGPFWMSRFCWLSIEEDITHLKVCKRDGLRLCRTG